MHSRLVHLNSKFWFPISFFLPVIVIKKNKKRKIIITTWKNSQKKKNRISFWFSIQKDMYMYTHIDTDRQIDRHTHTHSFTHIHTFTQTHTQYTCTCTCTCLWFSASSNLARKEWFSSCNSFILPCADLSDNWRVASCFSVWESSLILCWQSSNFVWLYLLLKKTSMGYKIDIVIIKYIYLVHVHAFIHW